jgi:hypothetical protein
VWRASELQDELIVVSPIVLCFAAILWAMVFLNTYCHFPKMDERQRLTMSLSSATILTLVLVAAVYAALYLILEKVI